MIEGLWAGLLLLAASHRRTRLVALLLAVKWATNYAAFRLIGEAAPVVIDIALGAVGVVWATRVHSRWADVVIAGFVLTPLVHAWYWFQYLTGTASPLLYYWLIIGLFTLQVGALAWPGADEAGRAILRWSRSLRTGSTRPPQGDQLP